MLNLCNHERYRANTLIIYCMVRFTSLYQCTNQLSVWYVPNCIDILTHGIVGYIDKLVCIAHTGPLSDQYAVLYGTTNLGFYHEVLWLTAAFTTYPLLKKNLPNHALRSL